MNPDMNSRKESHFPILGNHNGLIDLEQQGYILAEKIQFLENELQGTGIKLQALTFSKMELEKVLEKEKKESENAKSQLKLLQETVQQWEKGRNDKDPSIIQSFQLELLQKEKNSLNAELKSLESKNIELTVQVEEMQKRLQNQNDLENSFNSNKKAFEITVEKIYSESRKLEKEFNTLKKQVVLSKHAGEQMIILLKHHHEALNKTYEKNKSLNQTLFKQAGKLRLEKNTDDIRHEETTLNGNEVQYLRTRLKESEEKILSLNRELHSKIEEKKKLNETLNAFLNDQIKFNEMEQYYRTIISNLENQTEEKFQSTAN